MSKKLIAIISVVGVALLLAFTCPDKQDHKEALGDVCKTYFEKSIDKDNDNPFAMLGTMFATKLIDMFLDSAVKVDNYVFFSVGKLSYDGKAKTVSFGILKHVFTFENKDFDKAMKKAGDEVDESNEQEDSTDVSSDDTSSDDTDL